MPTSRLSSSDVQRQKNLSSTRLKPSRQESPRQESTREEPSQEQSSLEASPHVPQIFLDEEAVIKDLNQAARRVLEYSSGASIEPYFFAHVHGRNMELVMRDLAHMVARDKTCARWLLRLRTGNGRWRWYRAEAENRLQDSEEAIQVRFRRLSELG